MESTDNNNTGAEKKQPNPNELSRSQKRWAGIFLILFTLLPAFFIISLWPDRLPAAKENIKPLYHLRLLHMRLADICDTPPKCKPVILVKDTVKKETAKADSTKKDSLRTANAGSAQPETTAITIHTTGHTNCGCTGFSESGLWHINTILLLLVALAGFLGNMIHIATSFTNFVGAKTFEKSWMLWYCVKPFTAASLAVGLYFVFRGGFLNMSDDASNINLYGVMTISLLAGLFTDRATQKLKEVFEVLFQPKEERPNPMVGKPKIADIHPKELQTGKENIIKLKGENLENKKLIATINNETVAVKGITKNEATITYTIPVTQKDKTAFELVVKDEEGNAIGRFTLTVAAATPAAGKAEDEEEHDNDDANAAGPVVKE